MFGPLIAMTKKKETDPDFYRRALKYVYRVYNGHETKPHQDHEFQRPSVKDEQKGEE